MDIYGELLRLKRQVSCIKAALQGGPENFVTTDLQAIEDRLHSFNQFGVGMDQLSYYNVTTGAANENVPRIVYNQTSGMFELTGAVNEQQIIHSKLQVTPTAATLSGVNSPANQSHQLSVSGTGIQMMPTGNNPLTLNLNGLPTGTDQNDILTISGTQVQVLSRADLLGGAILNQSTAAQDPASFWVKNTHNELKFDAAGFTPTSTFLWNENAIRNGLNSNVGNYSLALPYIFRSDKMGAGNFQRGSLCRVEYIYGGDIGNTVWGNNVVWPQGSSLEVYRKMGLNNGTYNMQANNSFHFGALCVHQQLGSSNNDTSTPLDITLGANAESGYYGVYTRMDLWPGHSAWSDNGTSQKIYRGWLNMYTGMVLINAAAGSSIERLNYYVAGRFANQANPQTNITVQTMMGFYVMPMKQTWVTNAWGVYQEGTDDKNYFAGNVLFGSAVDDTVNKVQITGSAAIKGTNQLKFGDENSFIYNSAGFFQMESNDKTIRFRQNSNNPVTVGLVGANSYFNVTDGTIERFKVDRLGNTTVFGNLNLATAFTPTSSADAAGVVGDIARDDDYVYVKTSAGWKRSALETF